MDEYGREKIVTGKGVAYGRMVGEPPNSDRIEKVFSLSTDDLRLRFEELLTELPIDQIRAVEQIVDMVKAGLGREVSESLYIALADHLNQALSNYVKGLRVPNGLLIDVVRFYPDEYRLGVQALGVIHANTGIDLPMDEAGFIALHIVNAETGSGSGIQRASFVAEVIAGVLEIIRIELGIDIAEDSPVHSRLINHLRYFANRIQDSEDFSSAKEDLDLLRVVSATYGAAYRCAQSITQYIEDKYGCHVGGEELLYLTIHVQHTMQEKEVKDHG